MRDHHTNTVDAAGAWEWHHRPRSSRMDDAIDRGYDPSADDVIVPRPPMTTTDPWADVPDRSKP